MHLKDHWILVTGAAGGIGTALCHRLAQQGASLVLHGLEVGPLRELSRELVGQHTLVAADLGTAEGRATIVASCQEARIDGMVNLAGVLDFALYADQQPAAIERLLQVNVVAPMLLTRALLPLLLTRPEARIVNVGSIFGSIGHPGFVAYCASKAAIKAFSEALSRELDDTHVSVAYIAPRGTATPLNDDRVVALQRALGNEFDSPALVACEIAALLAGDAHFRYLGWPERLFVRLNALLPSVVHAALVKKLPLIKQHAKA